MEALLKTIFLELKKGVLDLSHPFRYICLSSVKNNMPQQRMVVLREVSENTLTIYTDIRTSKVSQFEQNPNASVLLYDYKDRVQIQLTGEVCVEKKCVPSIWDSFSIKAKKDYTTRFAPGTPVVAPSQVEYNSKINFCFLKFTFTSIDYLKIDTPYHTRAQFNLNQGRWEGTYLIP